jgi:DNA-binding MarR family transcriptional regulator
MEIPDTELNLLEKIYSAERSPDRITQRELAKATGLSLGMTNTLVRRMAEQGWVKLTRMSTKSVLYALTPAGVAEIARRAAGHFQRAARNAEYYRERIESFVLKAKADGATTLVLSGASEMSVLLEGICEHYGVAFIKSADPEKASSLGKRPGVVLLFAEGDESLGLTDDGHLKLSVASIISGAEGPTPESIMGSSASFSRVQNQ